MRWLCVWQAWWTSIWEWFCRCTETAIRRKTLTLKRVSFVLHCYCWPLIVLFISNACVRLDRKRGIKRRRRLKDSSVGEESASDVDVNEPSTSAAGKYGFFNPSLVAHIVKLCEQAPENFSAYSCIWKKENQLIYIAYSFCHGFESVCVGLFQSKSAFSFRFPFWSTKNVKLLGKVSEQCIRFLICLLLVPG